MNVEYINPFIRSTQNTFETMLNLHPKKTGMRIKETPEAIYDVSAVIGLGGSASGVVTLSFPKEVVLQVVSNFIGEPMRSLNMEVADAVGELVNMISGGAKTDLNNMGFNLSLALPNVVMGSDHQIWKKRDVPCVVLDFECEAGNFAIEVSLIEK